VPLSILLLLVLGGIAGIALALHLLGLTKTPQFTDETAANAWLRHHPDDTVLSVHLTQDGRAARVLTDRGRGIAWHMGADTCVRRLDGTEEAHARGDQVALHLNDYSAPRVNLILTADEQEEWANWMIEP
jgi:hypothetical protein